MNVTIVATRDCTHCANLQKELDDLGVEYEVKFVEENPDLVKKYAIRHSPNLIIDGEIVCRRQPTESELRQFLGLA